MLIPRNIHSLSLGGVSAWACLLLLISVLLFLGTNSIEPQQLMLDGSKQQLILTENICYRMESDSSDSWHCVGFKTPAMGYVPQAVTFRLSLLKKPTAPEFWYLEIPYPMLDFIELKYFYNEVLIGQHLGGDLLPFAHRKIAHRHHVFPLELKEPGSYELLVTIKTGSSLQFPMILRTPENFLHHERKVQYVHGIFAGLMLALICYNLFLFVAIREISYLFYVIFMFSHLLAQLSFNGFAYEYLWPEAVWWNDHAPRILVGIFAFFAFLFVHSFVRLPRRLPWLNYMLVFSIVLTASQFLTVIFADGKPAALATSLLSVILTVQILALTIYATVRGDTSAKFVLLSWLFFLTGAIMLVLKTHGLIPANVITSNGLLFGSGAEAVLLSFALAHRINRLKSEKAESQRELLEHLQKMDRYKDELNKSLERQVIERTHKIEEQSRELTQQLKMAANIQQSLLPQNIRDGRFNTVFLYQPSMSIGGDFLDCRLLSENTLGLFICDVSGHGVPAALLSSMVKITLTNWSNYSNDPAGLLHYIYLEIKDKLGNNFLTAAAVHLNLETGQAQLASAGHLPVILRNFRGNIRELRSAGTLIWFLSPPQCENMSFTLLPGDSLFLYTDGITEASSPAGELFEEERFYELIRSEGEKLADFPEILKKNLTDFTNSNGAVFADDISLIGFRYKTAGTAGVNPR